jgi:hypothetical protein
MIRGEIPPQQNVSKDFFLKCECVPKKTIMKSTLIRVLYKQFSQDDLLRYFEIQANWFFPFKKKFDLQINLDFVCTFTKCLFDVVCFIGQGPLYKWTEHSHNFIFWNYKLGGGGSHSTSGDFLDHTLLWSYQVHVTIYLLRGQTFFWVH